MLFTHERLAAQKRITAERHNNSNMRGGSVGVGLPGDSGCVTVCLGLRIDEMQIETSAVPCPVTAVFSFSNQGGVV